MRNFTKAGDIGTLEHALNLAWDVKINPFADKELGRDKTLLMIFFNSSLRTRLSTQKAAMNLGMNVIVLDINQGAWKLETELGVIMDGDKPEHILEAIPVMGSYCDVIGVRSFANLQNRESDYCEEIINQFIRLSGKPVFSMESATRHPLQSYADVITIEEYKKLADKYDFEIVDTGINTSADIEIAASDLVSKVDCLCNLTDNTVVNALQTVLDKANGAKIPVFGSEIEQVKSGCVASMGIDYYQLGIKTGKMAAKILKGEEKASDTPFITASKAELYVNTAAADKIGMTLDADYIKDAAETFDKIEVK